MAERHGKISVFDPKQGFVRQIGKLEVEDFAGFGLQCVTLDPNYMGNGWIYLFYHDKQCVYRLRRYTYNGSVLDLSKYTEIITIPMDREPGAHIGGSLSFDSKGLMYISIGDNTPPWQANGFPPMDENPGREIYDAQRTASNTNDLRGKILRIKPLAEVDIRSPKAIYLTETSPIPDRKFTVWVVATPGV